MCDPHGECISAAARGGTHVINGAPRTRNAPTARARARALGCLHVAGRAGRRQRLLLVRDLREARRARPPHAVRDDEKVPQRPHEPQAQERKEYDDACVLMNFNMHIPCAFVCVCVCACVRVTACVCGRGDEAHGGHPPYNTCGWPRGQPSAPAPTSGHAILYSITPAYLRGARARICARARSTREQARAGATGRTYT